MVPLWPSHIGPAAARIELAIGHDLAWESLPLTQLGGSLAHNVCVPA